MPYAYSGQIRNGNHIGKTTVNRKLTFDYTRYDELNKHEAKAAIPPRKGARIWQHGNSKSERHKRDENLRRVRKVGRKQWKKESSHHRRSLAETTVFRFKTMFGDWLKTRQTANQFKELLLKASILNRMTHLEMPATIKAG